MKQLKMRELETLSGVGREAIRFYIKEGILPEPEKPKRNVAIYSDEHVVRLKMIKRLQQEKSLALGKIKNVLADVDFSNLSPNSDLAAFEMAFLSLVSGNTPQKELKTSEVVARTGIADSVLQEMHQLGIVTILKRSDGDYLNFHDVAVLEKWSKIKALGFEDEAGYDLGFLKRYVDVTRNLAINEVTLFLRAYSRQPANDGAEMGVKGVEIANELLGVLHARAVADEVSRQITG